MEELTTVECRVLGALIEKALATPQQYPLSEQALLSACNQTSNREPITDYGIADVRRGLIGLRRAGIAREMHQPGARVEKHRHTADDVLELGTDGLAVLALLLLRGPQTPGELRTRSTRLHSFESVAAVVGVLDDLAARQPPLVRRLERRPGQKESRYAHLLGEDADDAAQAFEEPAAARAATENAPRPEAAGPPLAAASTAEHEGSSDGSAEIAALRAELADLRERVVALERRIDEG